MGVLIRKSCYLGSPFWGSPVFVNPPKYPHPRPPLSVALAPATDADLRTRRLHTTAKVLRQPRAASAGFRSPIPSACEGSYYLALELKPPPPPPRPTLKHPIHPKIRTLGPAVTACTLFALRIFAAISCVCVRNCGHVRATSRGYGIPRRTAQRIFSLGQRQDVKYAKANFGNSINSPWSLPRCPNDCLQHLHKQKLYVNVNYTKHRLISAHNARHTIRARPGSVGMTYSPQRVLSTCIAESRVSKTGITVMVWVSVPPYRYLGPFRLQSQVRALQRVRAQFSSLGESMHRSGEGESFPLLCKTSLP